MANIGAERTVPGVEPSSERATVTATSGEIGASEVRRSHAHASPSTRSVAFAAAMANAATPASGAAAVAPEPASIIVRVVMADGQTSDTVLATAPVIAAAPAKAPAIAKSRAS